MLNPAERPAPLGGGAAPAARRDAATPLLTGFAGALEFELDPFQQQACEALERGSGVLVCAPTGAGKTVVGEFAVHLALQQGRKCFYTTPIKALSNQKFHDLIQTHGADKVGLLTGDNSINGDAPVVVMTTEVLRNMLYARSSTLEGLSYVVMDEVHYLADRFRGAVWEEVIIHLPESVTLVSLSATVSNAEEFADWLVTVRGQTEVVVSEHRPVPLWQHMLVGKRMFDLFHDANAAKAHEVHPELLRHTREVARRVELSTIKRGGRRGQAAPYRSDIVERLDGEGLLPAILFIFSRAGCDAAVQQCMHAGLRLTGPDERAEIRQIAERRVTNIPSEDLAALGYWDWLDGLERGLAAHHAGMLPMFKEVVEELFVRGLVKAVFATETLALGINMPARCVVLERLVKFNGEAHVDLTPGEYTQLTGRAGRRGIDVEGHAVVVWTPEVDPRHVAGLASTRTYPLRSSFRPSYNMAVNLVGSVGAQASRELLESSFAQFQADRSVVGLARQVQRNNDTLASYDAEMECDHGDFAEYFDIRVKIGQREKEISRATQYERRASVAASLEELKIGDVIQITGGRRAGLAVVLDPGHIGFGEMRPLVLTEDRWAGRVSAGEFNGPVRTLGRVRVPRHFNHKAPAERRDLAARLRSADLDRPPVRRRRSASPAGEDKQLAALRKALRNHPCHDCPDREEHARWAEHRHRLFRDTEALRDKVAHRTNSLSRTFDRICELLTERGYLTTDGQVTDPGRMLSRLWTEADLLVAECLRTGVWEGLQPHELAGAASAVLYESRREGDEQAAIPRGGASTAVDDMLRIYQQLLADERRLGLEQTREPDLGFVWPIYRWAKGEPLSKVLASAQLDGDLPAGDFVRWARQVIDLLGQLAEAPGASAELRQTAKDAMDSVNRGILAYSSVS